MEGNMGPREKLYDEQIAPLMRSITELCMKHSIPMIASFELDPHPTHPQRPLLCTTSVLGPEVKATSSSLVQAAELLIPTIERSPQWIPLPKLKN